MYGSFLFVVAAAFVRVFLQKVSTMGLTCVLILLLRPKREDFISSSDVKAAWPIRHRQSMIAVSVCQ